MKSVVVFLTWALSTLWLFWLNRDEDKRVSKALWLPTIMLCIVGSRPVSAWLQAFMGVDPSAAWNSGNQVDAQLDGSPLDAAVYSILLLCGLAVMWQRARRSMSVLKVSTPVALYLTYTLLSVSWSLIPEAAFKRWTKDLCDLLMVLIIVTDPRPMVALRKIFSRTGILLLPASIFLIRYSMLGRRYDIEEQFMNIGVATNKNSLGLMAYVVSLGAVWSLFSLLRVERKKGKRRRVVAQSVLIIFGLLVLYLAHSATSVACFLFGAILIAITEMHVMRKRPSTIHVATCSILLVGGLLVLLGGQGLVFHALGRASDLTGRTAIWRAVIPLCPNPLFGAGFESFWNTAGRNIQDLSSVQSHNLASAHNGYIEVYLNLGLVGLSLMCLVILGAYRGAVAAFRRNHGLGGLALGLLGSAVIYSVSEAGFRSLTLSWISLLLVTVIPKAMVRSSGRAGSVVNSSSMWKNGVIEPSDTGLSDIARRHV